MVAFLGLSGPTIAIILKQFALGSSILGSFSSLSLLNKFQINKMNVNKFRSLSVILPIILGIGTVIAFFLFKYLKYQVVYMILGGIFGLIMTLYGKYILELTPKVFGIDEDKEYLVYLSAIGVYAVLFFFVLRPLAMIIL